MMKHGQNGELISFVADGATAKFIGREMAVLGWYMRFDGLDDEYGTVTLTRPALPQRVRVVEFPDPDDDAETTTTAILNAAYIPVTNDDTANDWRRSA